MDNESKSLHDLLYRDQSFAIIGAAMEVYNQLGCGFLEAVYQEALNIEFTTRNVPFCAQQPIQIRYKSHVLRQTYIPDFIAYEVIIVEIKALRQLGSIEEAQLLNYLKATGFRLGLLLNFGAQGKLEWKRMVK
ncbi:MAG: GxxExxY protein [Chloroflexales bacterium]